VRLVARGCQQKQKACPKEGMPLLTREMNRASDGLRVSMSSSSWLVQLAMFFFNDEVRLGR